MHKWQIFFWLAPRPALAGKASYAGEARTKKLGPFLSRKNRLPLGSTTEYVIEHCNSKRLSSTCRAGVRARAVSKGRCAAVPVVVWFSRSGPPPCRRTRARRRGRQNRTGPSPRLRALSNSIGRVRCSKQKVLNSDATLDTTGHHETITRHHETITRHD